MLSRPYVCWISAALLMMLASASSAAAAPGSSAPAGTLVVPVEFTDVRFGESQAELQGSLEGRVTAVRRYFARVLGPDSGVPEIDQETLAAAFPMLAHGTVAPVVRLSRPRAWFGRDRVEVELSESGRPRLRWWRDSGGEGQAWSGQSVFRRQVILALQARGEEPRHHAALVLVSAGRSAFPGSSQLWPATSVSADESHPPTIVVARGDHPGVWVHEIGHGLGLPDLYLDPRRRPGVDAGPLTAMAAGVRVRGQPVALTALERAWLVSHAKNSGLRGPALACLDADGRSSTLLVARTAVAPAARPRALLVASADGTPGGWLVEVFDRHGLDAALPFAPRPTLVVGRVLYRGLLGLRGGPRPLDPMQAGVLVTRVDSFDLASLRVFEPRGPGPLVGEVLPAVVSSRVPGLARVFLVGDELQAPDGTRIVVRSLRRATGGRPTEAEIQVLRGDPMPAGRARRVSLLRLFRERALRRFGSLVDQP